MNEFGNDVQRSLPEVKEDIGGALVRNMFEEGNISFMEGVQEKLNREQPYLSDALDEAMRTTASSEAEYNKMGLIVLFMYELLSEQAEADGIRRLFDASPDGN